MLPGRTPLQNAPRVNIFQHKHQFPPQFPKTFFPQSKISKIIVSKILLKKRYQPLKLRLKLHQLLDLPLKRLFALSYLDLLSANLLRNMAIFVPIRIQ